MTGSRQLDDLAALSDASYRARLTAMRDIVIREAGLRRDLAALSDRRRETQHLSESQLSAPRRIGADIQWQGWLDRRQRDLQTELAQTLARKADAFTRLSRAHGRMVASRDLAARRQGEAANARASRQAAALAELAILVLQGDG